MNTSLKGYTKEKACKDSLLADGWIIPFQSIRTRWATYDYADLFDVVAYKGKERKFISCKHFGHDYYLKHQQEIRSFLKEHGLPGESYELWMWSKARYRGRGKAKHWEEAAWKIIIIEQKLEKVKRYDFEKDSPMTSEEAAYGCACGMEECEDGEYCKFEDVKKFIGGTK